MKDKYSRNRKFITSAHKTFIIPAAGYLCIAVTWWILGILITSWLSLDVIPAFILNVLYLISGFFLLIMAVLSWVFRRKDLDLVVFLSMAALFFCLFLAHLLVPENGKMVQGYRGWFALIWALFFCYAWAYSIWQKTGFMRSLFILTFWMGTLAAALSEWTNGYILEILSGYILLISAVLALVVSLMEVLRYFRERFSGTGEGISINTLETP